MCIQAIVVDEEWVASSEGTHKRLITGEPVSLIAYHGFGRDKTKSIYSCGDCPILGKARYCGINQRIAMKFGDKVEELIIELSNPLVIDDENDLADFWESDMIPCKEEDFRKVGNEIRNYALNQNHDGVIINVGTGEMNLWGIGSKRIRAMFGDTQVVDCFC